MKIDHPFDLVIGADRSDAKADLCLIDTHTGPTECLTLSTRPESLHTWLAQLRSRYPKGRVAVCVEQPATDIILFLEAYSWITLFPINPLTLLKYREAFVTSRAKDDTKDADHLAELLLIHHDKLTPWHPEDPLTRKLQQWVRHRRAVIDERTRFTNRLQAILKQYFPQALDLCGDELWRPMATHFLLKWPSLQAIQKARPALVRQFYYHHGSRSVALLDRRMKLIAEAVPLTDESALIDVFVCRVQLICKELELVVGTIQDFDDQIGQVFASHPDREIFAKLPGAGPVLAPRLLASLGTQRERYPSSSSLQCFSGVAPVTKQSGGKCHVHRRYRCPLFLRQSFHEYAKESILDSRWAAAFYQQQTEKGAAYHTAVRALAFKWIRILWKCWQDRRPYSEEIYEQALKCRNSRLVSRLKKIEVGKSPVKKSTKHSKKSLV